MATKPKRNKPRVSITLEPEVYERIKRVADSAPGMNMSLVINELCALSLPVLEDMGKALREAINERGQLDVPRAKDALAKWAGAQLFEFAATFLQ